MSENRWHTEELDLDAYLARLGHPAVTAADEATLRSLHRAHLLAIPFENLDPLRGRTPELGLPAILRKLVHSARGGYCYEHNLLFAAVLERCGFRVTRSAARVNPFGDPPGPRTHMMLLTELAGQRWLTDVGFGAGLLEPVPLAAGEYRVDDWRYTVLDLGERWLISGGPREQEMYAVTGEPAELSDYEVYNHYTATNPASPFTGRLVAMRLTGTEHTLLHGDTLRVRYPDGAEETKELAAEQQSAVLAERFGIRQAP